MFDFLPFPLSRGGAIWLGIQLFPMVLHFIGLMKRRAPERFFLLIGLGMYYAVFFSFRGWDLLVFGRPGVSWYLIPLGFIAWISLYFPSVPYLLFSRLGALKYAVRGGLR